MKRMLLGGMLFVCGIIGILTFMVLAITEPWSYNGIEGLLGLLLGSGLLWAYILFSLMAAVGFIICLFEAYFKR